MSKPIRMSMHTRKNWLVDAAVFLGGILAALSGVYFLLMPSGGYRGGRNPAHGLTVLFSRHTWSDLHAWGGVLMIAAIAVHLAIHWQWVKMMSRRVWNAWLDRGSPLSGGAKYNVAINVVIAVSFLLCAISGVYFLFTPAGGLEGGHNSGWDSNLLFSRTSWDLLHSWSGVILIVAATLHFVIHWRWITNVTSRFFLSLLPQSGNRQVVEVPLQGGVAAGEVWPTRRRVTGA